MSGFCEIKVKLGKTGSEQTFHSDKELDSFLRDQAPKLENWYKLTDGNLDKIFSLDIDFSESKIESLSKIEDVKKAFDKAEKTTKTIKPKRIGSSTLMEHLAKLRGLMIEDVGEFDNVVSVKRGLSVTKFVENVGNIHDINKAQVTAVNTDRETLFRRKLEEEGFDKAIQDKLWEQELLKDAMSAAVGEDIHYILETAFRQISDPSIKLDLSKFTVLTEASYNKYKHVLDKIVDRIKNQFPDAQFYPEFDIVSKQIPDSIREALKQKFPDKKIDKIVGRIDLLVIDKDGKAHLFDWKTSAKRVWKWGEMDNRTIAKNGGWHSTKKLKSWQQLGSYGAILEQYGIPVESMEVIPLYLDFEKKGDDYTGELTTLEEDKTIDGGNSRPYTKNALRSSEWIFSVTKPIKIDTLRSISDIIAKMFPGTNIATNQRKHIDATAEFYMNDKKFVTKISEGTTLYKEGVRYTFRKYGLPDKRVVKCKTKEELQEKLGKYVEELNSYNSSQMVNFASDLANVIHTKGENEEVMETWLGAFSPSSKNFLKDQFKKYYKNGWSLTINEELNNNGIFIFAKNDKVEIVTLSDKSLHHIFRINGQANIAGYAKMDNEDETDPINLMNSQYGNMLLMKIACLIAKNPELLQDRSITNVKVLNPWHRTISQAHSNKNFIHNWNILAKNYSEPLPLLDDRDGKSLFMNDAAACLLEASQIVLANDVELSGTLLETSKNSYSDQQTIESLMLRVRRAYPETFNVQKTPEGFVYVQLQLALLHNMGIRVIEEPNVASWFIGVMPTGNMVTNPQESKSANVRMLASMFDQYRDVYTEKYTAIAEKFMQLVRAVYEEWGFNPAIDSAKKFWEKFFEHEEGEDSPIDSSFRLKHPNNSIFDGKEKSKELINYILEYLNMFKYKGKIDDIIDTPEYYEVPLLEASFAQTVVGNIKNNGFKGAVNGLWQGVKQLGNKLEDAYTGASEFQETYKDATALDVAYNKYLDLSSEEREKLLSDPSRIWDTNLETIFLHAMASTAVSEASKQYGIYFTAFNAAINYLQNVCNVNIPDIVNYVEKYVKNRVFLKNIREKSLDTMYSVLKVMKSITSGVALKLNTRAMTREYLVSLYTAYSRTSNYQVPGITAKHFSDAIWYVVKQAPVSFETQNFIAALNRRYAMTQYSSTEMGDVNRQAKWGIQNITSDDLYITSQLADNHFRMAILIAKLMADGALEAYRMDGPDLHYNWKLDKRFSAFANGNTSDATVYGTQRALFIKTLKDWKFVHSEFNLPANVDSLSDEELRMLELPDAYPPKFKGSIRQMASHMFGYFDTEDKSLLTATLGGAAFMQYKTWLSAKLNQHLKQPGFVNIWRNLMVRDPESGEPLWLVYTDGADIEAGAPAVRAMKESAVPEEAKRNGTAVPWIIEEGTFQEGTIMSMGKFLADIIHWDMDSFKRDWEDPARRGNLIVGLLDSFGMMLLMGIITALYGEDKVNNMANEDWVTQWSYGVLMGFAEDGPIHRVIASTAGDLNPPSMVAIQKWAQTVNSVLAGNKSVGQGLVESFGVTREFKGFFA